MAVLSTFSFICINYVQLTLSMAKEERNAPNVAINPPKKAVFRIPRRSTKTPDIGDIRKVVPISKDPSRDDMVSEVL